MNKLFLSSLVLSVTLIGCNQPQHDSSSQPAGTNDPDQAELLFVQEAQSIAFNGNTLTMKDVKPSILFFTDRPERVAGYWTLDEFMDEVSTGPDSFAADPPNATLVSLVGNTFVDVVLELAERPRHEDGAFIYPNVRIIEGEPPAVGGASALFIDVIGRPMSPGSVAGVHRRHRRRAVRRHTP
ncbi:MAG: hypothetical protein E2P03_06945 [Acidobacteria bacterium]|nr:MAG: hypothetical protein E2P03_06945 [Acidobacteriota bacterium]